MQEKNKHIFNLVENDSLIEIDNDIEKVITKSETLIRTKHHFISLDTATRIKRIWILNSLNNYILVKEF